MGSCPVPTTLEEISAWLGPFKHLQPITYSHVSWRSVAPHLWNIENLVHRSPSLIRRTNWRGFKRIESALPGLPERSRKQSRYEQAQTAQTFNFAEIQLEPFLPCLSLGRSCCSEMACLECLPQATFALSAVSHTSADREFNMSSCVAMCLRWIRILGAGWFRIAPMSLFCICRMAFSIALNIKKQKPIQNMATSRPLWQ